MLELLPDLPDHVLGVRAKGEVTADDYQTVLVPAVENMLARHRKVRLLYVLDSEFTGFSAAAAWEDAKVGMRHFTAFERVAVVTDVDWISRMVKAFGFVLPGEVRIFTNDGSAEARAWITEPPPPGKLASHLSRDKGVLVLEPGGELRAADFERLAAEVDPYIAEAGGLAGLVIVAEEFPGWADFAAFTSHLRFIREHISRIRRVALVTSSRFLSVAPRLANLFVHAEVRRFAFEEREAAMAWVTDDSGS